VGVFAEQAEALGERDQFCERLNLKLFHQVVAVPFDRALSATQFVGNLFVELPANDQRKDFALSRRETMHAGAQNVKVPANGTRLAIARDGLLDHAQ
jgi:hypothetical protein